MSTEENKINNRRFYEEVWNGGNLAVVDELVAPNAIFHDPTTTLHGPEGFKQYVTMCALPHILSFLLPHNLSNDCLKKAFHSKQALQ